MADHPHNISVFSHFQNVTQLSKTQTQPTQHTLLILLLITFLQLSFRSQFHDKMDPLLETLEGAVQRLRQPPSVAAEVEKIREQLAEHRAQGLELDKLLPSFSALCARGEELIGRAAHDDPAAQGEVAEMCLTVNDRNITLKMTQARRCVKHKYFLVNKMATN